MKQLSIIFILLSIYACGPARDTVAGAPEKIRMKTLLGNMEAAENEFESLAIRYQGNFQNAETDQAFRAEVRILKDSIIWVDLADPFLGIKVARAIIYPDSAAFIQRLSKEYFTGTPRDLQQKLKLEVSFEMLQAVFSGNLVLPPGDNYELSYKPGYYYLTDFPQETAKLPGAGPIDRHSITVEPQKFKAAIQTFEKSSAAAHLTLEFKDFEEKNGRYFPALVKLELLRFTERGTERNILELTSKEVDINPAQQYPFNIPSSYAKMP